MVCYPNHPKLNFCCGQKAKPDFVNIDGIVPDFIKGTFIKVDVDKFPYPFKDNTFGFVYASSCLEHLNNLYDVFKELHRICKPDAIILCYNSFWLHPDSCAMGHKTHGFTKDFFISITDNQARQDSYRPFIDMFDIEKIELTTDFKLPKWFVNKFANVIPCLVNGIKHYIKVKK